MTQTFTFSTIVTLKEAFSFPSTVTYIHSLFTILGTQVHLHSSLISQLYDSSSMHTVMQLDLQVNVQIKHLKNKIMWSLTKSVASLLMQKTRLNILETAVILGFSHTTVSRVYRESCRENRVGVSSVGANTLIGEVKEKRPDWFELPGRITIHVCTTQLWSTEMQQKMLKTLNLRLSRAQAFPNWTLGIPVIFHL